MVLCMAQTEDGLLWFGTADGGLLLYDGQSWQAFTTAQGLPSDRVLALASAGDGSVWLGTPAGAARFRPAGAPGSRYGLLQVFTEREGLPNNAVTSLCVARDGSVWVGTRGGVARYGMTGWVYHSDWVGAKDPGGTKLVRDSEGSLWAAAGGILYKLGDGGWRENHRLGDTRPGRTVELILGKDGTLWMATPWEILRHDGTGWREMGVAASGLTGPIVSFSPGEQYLWAGTRNGVYRFDGTLWEAYVLELSGRLEEGQGGGTAGLPAPVTAVLEAPSGELWFGLLDGLIRQSDETRQHFSEADGLPGGPVIEILESREGSIWVSTLYGGVARYEGGEWASVPHEIGTTFNEVQRIYEANDGTFWLWPPPRMARYTPTAGPGRATPFGAACPGDGSGMSVKTATGSSGSPRTEGSRATASTVMLPTRSSLASPTVWPRASRCS